MNEVFVECIVKRKLSVKGLLLRMLCILLVFAGLISMLFLGVLGFTITVLLAYLTYIAFAYTSIEYEYSFLNGELTVDRIAGQRKRKTMGNYEMKQAEIVAPTLSDDIMRMSNRDMKVADYSTGHGNENTYSMILNDDTGMTQVIFEKEDKIIDGMYHARPGIVKIQ